MKQLYNILSTEDDVLEKEDLIRSGQKSRETGVFWPSEASISFIDSDGLPRILGKCHRAIYYSFRGIKPTDPPSAQSLRKMRLGKLIEEEERVVGMRAGTIVPVDEKDRKFRHAYGGITISGEEDIRHVYNGKVVIGEIKSGYGYDFDTNKIKKGIPDLKHVMQIMFYLDDRQTPIGVIRYYSRGECTRRLVPLVFKDGIMWCGGKQTPVVLEKVLERFNTIHQCIISKDIPLGDFTPVYSPSTIKKYGQAGRLSKTRYNKSMREKGFVGDWECSYCSYRSLCTVEQGQNPDL